MRNPSLFLPMGLLLPALLSAQAPTLPAASPRAAASALTPSFSLRTRAESWDWFDAGPEGRYAFLGAIARGGVAWQRPGLGARVELAAPLLLGLPEDAVRPAPQGQLGLGAGYWAANDSAGTDVSLFLKQAVVRVGAAQGKDGHSLRAGRFEFNDGAETAPADPTVAAVKRDRVSQRLLGAFGWSHVGRSFDGGAYAFDRRGANVTVLAARPTRGAFRTNGWGGLDVGVAYAALTVPTPWLGRRGEARLFGLHYRDDRELPKLDNRPAPARALDSSRLDVTTVGAHLVQVVPTGLGPVDLLAWGAVQLGDWGGQTHRAHALALEVGVQPAGLPALKPWLRAGYYCGSGDADAADDRHGTFFNVLPTPRIYARLPFHNAMNLEEAFGSLVLRPGAKLTVRADARVLGLAERTDLWYGGGGAFEPGTLGFAGRPSGGARKLGTLLDVGAEWRATPRVTVAGYVGHVAGGPVLDNAYGADATGGLAYLELEIRR